MLSLLTFTQSPIKLAIKRKHTVNVAIDHFSADLRFFVCQNVNVSVIFHCAIYEIQKWGKWKLICCTALSQTSTRLSFPPSFPLMAAARVGWSSHEQEGEKHRRCGSSRGSESSLYLKHELECDTHQLTFQPLFDRKQFNCVNEMVFIRILKISR